MEIFEVFYDGNKLEAKKTKEGKIYVDLPKRKRKQGDILFERISRDSEGWKYSCVSLKDFENEFKLWIRDDGRIAAYNNKTNKVIITKDIFDPNSPNMGQINHLVTEIYRTVEQLRNYEKKDIPAEVIIKLRRAELLTSLKMLGYSSIENIETELNDSKLYFALGRIREQLSKYINLANYIHIDRDKKDEEVVRVNIPEGLSREQFLSMIEPVKDTYVANESYMREQNEKMEQKRSITSDYCERISKKMPYSDWLLYSRVVKQTAELLLALNADLFLGTDIEKKEDLKQKIFAFINSKDFAKACDIENRVIIREAKRLITDLESMLDEFDEENKRNPIAKSLEELIKEENMIIKERNGETSKNIEGVTLDD